jgi:hypothetical protein
MFRGIRLAHDERSCANAHLFCSPLISPPTRERVKIWLIYHVYAKKKKKKKKKEEDKEQEQEEERKKKDVAYN